MKRRSSTPGTRQLLRLERRLSTQGFCSIAGIDEAGRGPLAGPVVAGAVILPERHFSARIDDSKRLSPRQRETAYQEIMAHAHVGVGIIDERRIDLINIRRATREAMLQAIASLPIIPDYILVDGNMLLPSRCPCKTVVGGDGLSLSIAAASIIAKVTRDRIMREYHAQYPQYGFSRHQGYPTKLHREALRIHGPSPIHRLTFRPVIACTSR